MPDIHMTLALFHIFVVSPFLLYIVFLRGTLGLWMFNVLQIVGIFVLIYHTYRAMVRWKAHSSAVWINLIHIILVAPLLIYIGNSAYDTPRWAYELLAMLAFAALGYHIYSMVLMIQEMHQEEKKYSVAKRAEETKDSS